MAPPVLAAPQLATLEAVSATASAVVLVSLPLTSRWIDSYRKYGASLSLKG